MAKSSALPQLTAPDYRVATTGKELMGMLRADLKEVVKQSQQWVQLKAPEETENEIKKGNTPEFTTVVDGSKSKPVEQAQRKVVVYFVSAVLTRELSRAKDVLLRNIKRLTTVYTGRLTQGWTWYLQTGGQWGRVQRLGESLPSNARIHAGESLILAPTADYAWFANSSAMRENVSKQLLKRHRENKKFLETGKRRRGKPISATPKGMGFMGQTAKQLRSELSHVGFKVTANFTTSAPPGPASGWRSTRRGIPILIFYVDQSFITNKR
jgi:hypothetical protein